MNREILSINMSKNKVDIFKVYFALNELTLIYCQTEKEGMRSLDEAKTALIILDASTYSSDEVQEAVSRFRRNTNAPILVMGNDEVEAPALEVGADGFLVPTIGPHRLFANAMALIRRRYVYDAPINEPHDDTVMRFGELAIDHVSHYVTLAGKEIHLTPNEYRLLAYFAQNPGIVLSQEQISYAIWLTNDISNRDAYRVVSELRNKLNDGRSSSKFIQTVHGFGYRFLSREQVE